VQGYVVVKSHAADSSIDHHIRVQIMYYAVYGHAQEEGESRDISRYVPPLAS
jgi:hypothetical protein